MNCPECNSNTLAICRDVIVAYRLISRKGKLVESSRRCSENILDNCWLECGECGSTSEDNDKVRAIYKEYANG
jgi:hypothetical protein